MSKLTLGKGFTLDFAHKIILAIKASRIISDRSSRPELFCKKIIRKIPVLETVLIKLHAWRPDNQFQYKWLHHRYFSVNFAKFLKNSFFYGTLSMVATAVTYETPKNVLWKIQTVNICLKLQINPAPADRTWN